MMIQQQLLPNMGKPPFISCQPILCQGEKMGDREKACPTVF